jgi:hypothetical protein
MSAHVLQWPTEDFFCDGIAHASYVGIIVSAIAAAAARHADPNFTGPDKKIDGRKNAAISIAARRVVSVTRSLTDDNRTSDKFHEASQATAPHANLRSGLCRFLQIRRRHLFAATLLNEKVWIWPHFDL